MGQSSYLPSTPPPAAAGPAPDEQRTSSYLTGDDRLGSSLAEAYKTPADRAARVLELRLRTGLAPTLIDRNFDELDREDRQKGQIDANTLRKFDPGLAGFLADPTTAAAAQDDIPKLRDIERGFRAVDPLLRGIDQLQSTLYGFTEWAGEATGIRGLTSFGREGRTRNAAEAALYGRGPTIEEAFDSPGSFVQWAYNTLGEQLPMMAPTLGGGVVGGAVAGSMFGPAGVVIGGAIGAFVPGLAMGVGETQGNLKDLDPTASAPMAVFIGGTAIAALDSVLPGKVGAKLVRTFGRETAEEIARRALTAPVKSRHLVKTAQGAITGMATEGFTEAIQEAIGAVAAAEGAGVDVNWEQLRSQALEAGAAGALMGSIFGGGSSVLESRRHEARRLVAEQQQAVFTALGQSVVDSKLIERLPEAGREFVSSVTKDGPIETVYLPADKFEEYFQSKGVEPGLVAQELTGDVNALEQAKRDGTLLAIPTDQYAAKIAPTEHQAFFARELKLRPNLLNIREVEELEETVAAGVQHSAVREADEQTTAARDEIARQFTDMAIERGAPKFQAEPWGHYIASRYVERARRKGVDPLELFKQQPREIVIQEADGATLMPQVVQGEAQAGIPPSVATPGETSEARTARRRAHVSALASSLVRDAQRLDPSVDPAQIAAELDFRMAFAEEQRGMVRESGTGQDLLRAVAGYGGVWWETKTGGFRGEIEHLVESGRDIRGVTAGSGRVVHQAGRATYNGVPGVYREGGLTPDAMVEALRQDQRFEYITHPAELFDALDVAQSVRADIDQFPGSQELEQLGIRPGTRWWSDSWRGVDATETLDSVTPEGDVDVSFNPEEFQQLVEREATPIARVEALPPASQFEERGAKRVPFPSIPDAIAQQLFRASFAVLNAMDEDVRHEQLEQVNVPIGDVVATQDWIFPDTVKAYLDTQEAVPPVIAMFYQGRYYLTDGTHRAVAAWARGDQVVPATVLNVDEALLDRELEPPAGGTAGPIRLLQPGTEGAQLQEEPRGFVSPGTLAANDALIEFRAARDRAKETAAEEGGDEFFQSARRLDDVLRRREEEAAAGRLERESERTRKARTARTDARQTAARRRQAGEFFQRLTAPPPVPLRQIDTPAFTAWFDNSVVTEGDGEPRIVYGTADAGTPAFFVSSSRAAAAATPAYLSMQTPLDLRDIGLRTFTPEQFVAELETRGVTLTPELLEAIDGTSPQPVSSYLRRLSGLGLGTVLRASGYDGAAIREQFGEDLAESPTRTSDAWVVYSTEQIRLPTGSRQDSIVREAASVPTSGQQADRINAEIFEITQAAVVSAISAAAQLDAGVIGTRFEAWLDNQGGIFVNALVAPGDRLGALAGTMLQKLIDYADVSNLQMSIELGGGTAGDFWKSRGFDQRPGEHRDVLVRPALSERRPPSVNRRYRTGTPLISNAELATKTELVTVGSRQLGANVVRSADDAAAALQYLSRGAQERFDGLVTDADGTPLALVGSFKGKVDQAVVFGETIVNEAVRVKGAARIWFAHNHPSGSANLSTEDRLLNASLTRRFRDTGIEPMGLMAIGAGEAGAQVYQFQDADAQVHDGIVRVDDVQTSVPIVERELVATGKLQEQAIHSPALAMRAGAALLGSQFGVIYLDTQNRPIAASPIDVTQAGALRSEGRLRQLLESTSTANASGAIVWSPQPDAPRTAVLNLANAFKANGVTVLDVASPFGTLGPERIKDEVSGEFFQPDEPDGGIRGAFNPRTGRIRLIAGAQNLSTFLHESGHAFLDELMADALDVDVATANDLQKGLVSDAQTSLRWMGFEGTIADFQALTVNERRPFHEKWADGFEAYLMTGEAPSIELRELFAKFRAWLVAVYKVIRRFGRVDRATAEAIKGVQLGDEIRAVMDRLLASDEAIAAARAEGQVDPLFTDAASAGVDALTFAAYQQQIVDANRQARESLDKRLLEDWRRERAGWWQNERDAVRSEIEREAMTNPVFVALSVIRTGKMPDGSMPPFSGGHPLKLSKREIVRMKGDAFLKRLPKPYLYTVDGGLHPDVVAELVGFSSGDALLESLIAAKPMRPLVDAEADRQMRERHGDLLLDGIELKDLADQAVHEHRAEVIAAELKALTQGMAGATIPPAASLRQAAVQRIASMRIRELRPGLFLQAAQRASTQAFQAFARNDRAAAVRFKQQELTSLALFRAAGEAKDRAIKSAHLLQAFQVSPGRRRTLLHAGQDYLDQVDALLERYEVTKSSQVQIDRRSSLRHFVEAQIAKGLPVTIPDWVIDDSRRINYVQLTVEELEGVRASVEQIAHLARLKDKLLKAQEERTLNEIVGEISGSIRAHNAGGRSKTLEPRAPGERARKFAAGISMSHRKIASIARELDGFEDGGPMFEHVIRRVNEAGNSEASMNQAASTALEGLFRTKYSGAELAEMNTKRRVPELEVRGEGGFAEDVSLSKQALLMLALNQGNETNRQRLRDGYGWTQEQMQRALDNHLDRRDWEFVQSVWDYIDTFWPLIVEKQQRVIGVPPEKVLATPVFTRFGEFRGGYFPIKFERELSGRIYNLEEAAAADMQKAAAYVHATTARGHLERRVEGNVKEHPVRLDFGVLWEHVGQVIHDVTHHEMLIDVGRILGSKEVESAIRESLGIAAFEQFRSALKDIAIGDVPAKHEAEGVLRYLRNGATVVGLGWNVTTSALQFVGLTQSVHRIGAKWVGLGMASFLRGAVAMDGSIAGNLEESEMLRNRANTLSPELHDVRRRIGVDTGKITGWMDAGLRAFTRDTVTRQGIADSYLWMITRTQLLVDHMTYMGARAKAAADPANTWEDGTLDLARVIAIAEQAVLDSQGGGQIKDLAAVQRGGPAWKLWINFYSFFNVTFNAWAESVRRAGGQVRINKNPIAVGRLAVDFMLLFSLPTVLSHLVRSAMTGELDDELEDPAELAANLAKEHLAYMVGTMVLLRELGGVIQGYSGYEGPAGARGLATISKFIAQVSQLEADEAFWRTLNQTGGVLFHYPAGQVERTVRGIQALIDGETENPAAVVAGPPRR